MDLHENETPVIKALHSTYIKSVEKDLDRNYFIEFGSIRKWMCFSDYAYDKTKSNHVITFSLHPYVSELELKMNAIRALAPKEIKNASSISPSFIHFLRYSPFVTFSFIIENHKYLFLQDHNSLRESMLISLNQILDSLPRWTIETPHLNHYHREVENKIRKTIRLVKLGKKIQPLKNLFLTTSLGSYLCTQFANKTNAELFGWFSDRDAINDLVDYVASDLFNIQFSSYLGCKCEFVYAPAASKDTEWYEEFIRIPDYISGALADYDLKTGRVTHDKFTPIFEKVFADNKRNIFIFKLVFHEEAPIACYRLKFRGA